MFLRTEKIIFQGGAGVVDCVVDHPEGAPRGWALVLHPHPLYGGTRENKIVTTMARACVERGLVAVRPNFRGVGASAGEFDQALGETADMVELVGQFERAYPDAAAGAWVLAGFSFGTAVAAHLYTQRVEQRLRVPDRLILIGCAVQRFHAREVSLPADTLMVHGESDEVVPLSEGLDFARVRDLPVTVVPDGSHFFHGKLLVLRQILQTHLSGL
ncbi:alpha/beta hydrolase [Alcaligenaceae bacterium CGII-47]|nr:alpha/beta hydrolase [Alcaligenaceae bacterium CGII-47]